MNDFSVFSHVRLNDRTYWVTESYGFNSAIPNSYMHLFVIVGDEKVAVIDSGIAGTSGLRGYIEEKILGGDKSKPIICLLTHNHVDHIGGCMMFDEVYLNPIDIAGDLAWNTRVDRRLMDDASDLVAFANYNWDVINYCREHYYKPAPTAADFRPVNDGDIFDLGGITLQAIHMPGHTAGSTGYYDALNHVAHTGDSMSMGRGGAQGVYEVLGRCRERWAPDTIITDGHGAGIIRMEILNNMYRCAEEVMLGINLENDETMPPRRGGPGFFKFTKAYAGIEEPAPAIDPNTVTKIHVYKDARVTYTVKKEN